MKYRIEMAPLAGRWIVALKDPDTGALVKTMKVNAMAAEMMQGLSSGLSPEDLADSISRKYGVSREIVSRDLEPIRNMIE